MGESNRVVFVSAPLQTPQKIGVCCNPGPDPPKKKQTNNGLHPGTSKSWRLPMVSLRVSALELAFEMETRSMAFA